MPRSESATPKTAKSNALKKVRPLVPRGLPPTPGISNIIVVRSGDGLNSLFRDRLRAMEDDFKKVEFFWNHLVNDPSFHECREYKEYGDVVRGWELRENIRTLAEYKTKMERYKVLIDHFQPGKDYELTVQEAVEALS